MRVVGGGGFYLGLYQAAPSATAASPSPAPVGGDEGFFAQAARHLEKIKDGRVDISSQTPLPRLKIAVTKIPLYGDVFLHVDDGTQVSAHVRVEGGVVREIEFRVESGFMGLKLLKFDGLPKTGIRRVRITNEGKIFVTLTNTWGPVQWLLPLDFTWGYEPHGRFLPFAFREREIEITSWPFRQIFGIHKVPTNLQALARHLLKPTGPTRTIPQSTSNVPWLDLLTSLTVRGFFNLKETVKVPGPNNGRARVGTIRFHEERLDTLDVNASGVSWDNPGAGAFEPLQTTARNIDLRIHPLRFRSREGFEARGTFTVEGIEANFPGRLSPQPIHIRAGGPPYGGPPGTKALAVDFTLEKAGKEVRLETTYRLPQLTAGNPTMPVGSPFTSAEDLVMALDSTGQVTATRMPNGGVVAFGKTMNHAHVPTARLLPALFVKLRSGCEISPYTDDLIQGPWSADFICRADQADMTWYNPRGEIKLETQFPPGRTDHLIRGRIERHPGKTVIHIDENRGPYNFAFPRLADGGWHLKVHTAGSGHLRGLTITILDGGPVTFTLDSFDAHTLSWLDSRRIANFIDSLFEVRDMVGTARPKYLMVTTKTGEPFVTSVGKGTLTFRGKKIKKTFRIDKGHLELSSIEYASPTALFRGTITLVHSDVPNNLLQEIRGAVIELQTGDGRPDRLDVTMTARDAILKPDGSVQIRGTVRIHTARRTLPPPIPPLPPRVETPDPFPEPPTRLESAARRNPFTQAVVPWILKTAAQLLQAVDTVPVAEVALPHGPGEIRFPILGIRSSLRLGEGEFLLNWTMKGDTIDAFDIGFDKPVRVCIPADPCLTQEEFKIRRIHLLTSDDPWPAQDPVFPSSAPTNRRRERGEMIFEFDSLFDMNLAKLALNGLGITDDDLETIGWGEQGLVWKLPLDFPRFKFGLAHILFKKGETLEEKKGGEDGRKEAEFAITAPLYPSRMKVRWDSRFQAARFETNPPFAVPFQFEPSATGSRLRVLRQDTKHPFQVGAVEVPALLFGPVMFKGFRTEGGPIRAPKQETDEPWIYEAGLQADEFAAELGAFRVFMAPHKGHPGGRVERPYFVWRKIEDPDGKPDRYPELGAERLHVNLSMENEERGISAGVHSTIDRPRLLFVNDRIYYAADSLADPEFRFAFRHFGVRGIHLEARGIGMAMTLPPPDQPLQWKDTTLEWKEDRVDAHGGVLVFGKTEFALGENSFVEGGRLSVAENEVRASAEKARVCLPVLKADFIAKLQEIPGLSIQGTTFRDTCFEGQFFKESTISKGNLRLRGDFEISSHGDLALTYKDNAFASPVTVRFKHVRELDFIKNRLRRLVFQDAVYQFGDVNAAIVFAQALGLKIRPQNNERGQGQPSRLEVKIGGGEIVFGRDGKLSKLTLERIQLGGFAFAESTLVTDGKARVFNPNMTMNGRALVTVRVERQADGRLHIVGLDYHTDGHIHTEETRFTP